MNEITLSKLVQNKTHQYLYPCLKVYGKEFRDKVNSLFKVAIGIDDVLLTKNYLKYDKHLFLLINTNHKLQSAKEDFQTVLVWLRQQKCYEHDYIYDNDNGLHMLVIKFPEQYLDALKLFKLGQFSKMMDEKSINELYKIKPDNVSVITKDAGHRTDFLEKLNAEFGTSLTVQDLDDEAELDFVLERNEVFNSELETYEL